MTQDDDGRARPTDRGVTTRPVAARGVAFAVPSRWSGRAVRRVRHDALWPDGRVEYDVSLVDAMYRGAPADYSAVAHAVGDRCPELGAGPWIDDWALEVDGPGLPAGRAVDATEGARREFRPLPITPRRSHPHRWRIVVGSLLLAVGTAGLAVGGAVGPVGFLWFLPTVCGLALLGSLVGRHRRR